MIFASSVRNEFGETDGCGITVRSCQKPAREACRIEELGVGTKARINTIISIIPFGFLTISVRGLQIRYDAKRSWEIFANGLNACFARSLFAGIKIVPNYRIL